MTHRGLKKLLVDFLKADGGWVHSGALERRYWVNPKNGRQYKPSTMSRRLRELAEDAILFTKEEHGVWYRFNLESLPKKQEYRIEERNGARVAVLV